MGSLLALWASLAPISFPARFYGLEEAVTKLGADHRVVREWKDVPVFLALKDASAEAHRERFARLVRGRWTKTETTWTLEPDPSLRTELSPRWIQAIREALAKEADQIVEEGELTEAKIRTAAEKRKAQSGADLEATDAFELSPPYGAVRHAVVPLLNKIGAPALASIGFGERVVFSTRPTAAQRALPVAAVADLLRFLRDQATAAKAREPGVSMMMRTQVGSTSFFGEGPTPDGDPAKPDLAILSLYRSFRLGGFLCELGVYDPAGKGISSSTYFLSVKTLKSEPVEVPELTISPEATALARAFGSGVGANLPQRSAVVELESEPGTRMIMGSVGVAQGLGDPLVLTASRPLLGEVEVWDVLLGPALWAWAEGTEVAALLPDPTVHAAGRALSKGRISKEGLGKWLAEDPDVEFQATTAFVEIRPSSAVTLREGKVDRQALRNLGAAIRTSGGRRLVDLLQFSQGYSGDWGVSSFGAGWLACVDPVVSGELSPLSLDVFRILRVYAQVSEATRNQTEAGQPFPFDRLSPRAWTQLQYAFFNSQSGYWNGEEMAYALQPKNTSKERTCAAPSGLSRRGFLKVEKQTANAWQGQETSTGRSGYGSEELIAMSPSPGMQPDVRYQRFRPAERIVLLFTAQDDVHRLATTASDVRPLGDWINLSDMPDAWRKKGAEIRAKLSQYRVKSRSILP